jgi:hypothetical protein
MTDISDTKGPFDRRRNFINFFYRVGLIDLGPERVAVSHIFLSLKVLTQLNCLVKETYKLTHGVDFYCRAIRLNAIHVWRSAIHVKDCSGFFFCVLPKLEQLRHFRKVRYGMQSVYRFLLIV